MEFNRLVPGVLLERKNRFVATVKIEGEEHLAHVPSTGRLGELMQKGAPVFLNPRPETSRKTRWDLILVKAPGGLVAVDSRLATSLFAEALLAGDLAELKGMTLGRKEVRVGQSRLDFQLHSPEGPVLVEVKSVNLMREGMALFPDAPTSRGTRHIEELIRVQENGGKSLLFFAVQREDVSSFAPNQAMDPDFAGGVVRARQAGVLVLAYKCEISIPRIKLGERIEVILGKVGDMNG